PFLSPFDKRAPIEDPVKAPVSYGMNSNLSGQTSSNVYSATNCILLSVEWNPSTQQGSGTAAKPTALKLTSNPGPKGPTTGGTFASGRQINVVFADYHVAPMTMSDFHNSTNPIKDTAGHDLRG